MEAVSDPEPAPDPTQFVDAEKVTRFNRAVVIAREQRDPEGETFCDYPTDNDHWAKSLSPVEALLAQELKRLWDALGVAPPE